MYKRIEKYFNGWTKMEKRDFLLSLLLTVAFCIALIWAMSLFQETRPHHLELNALNTLVI